MDKVHSERSKRLFCFLSVDGAKGNTSYLKLSFIFLFSQAEWLRRKFRMRIDQCLLICVIFLISKTFNDKGYPSLFKPKSVKKKD